VTIVRIVKSWSWPNLLRQTPDNKGIWDRVHFALDTVEECDYVIVLNHPAEDVNFSCSPEHIWAIMQEPPNEYFGRKHRGDMQYYRVYTSNKRLKGEKYIHSQPALPWHLDKDYDYLLNCDIPDKPRRLSWITSNISAFKGHRERLKFLRKIQDQIDFDLYGRGFKHIGDKWDGLAPYQYSLAIENFRNSYYWSEKLADCFLAWSMPIYFGCTKINDFFPSEAMIQVDINDSKSIEIIKSAISSDLWRQNLDAISHARQLVLNKYQLFPFVVERIRDHERHHQKEAHIKKTIFLPHEIRIPITKLEQVLFPLKQYIPLSLRRKIAEILTFFR